MTGPVTLEFVGEQLERVLAELATMKIHISGLPLIATSLHELRDDVRELRRESRCCTRRWIRSPTRRSISGRRLTLLESKP